MSAERPLTALIAALGGQGGGVLVQWLAEAAHAAGYPAQATSTPGVAQRTGATTCYFELFPDAAPAADPLFSLFPSSGDVDLVAALEPMEAARALELGFVTDRTTVITANERTYAIGEKMVAGDGAVDAAGVLVALAGAAKRLIALDLTRLAADSGSRGNAVLLGAMIGSGVLPLTREHCRRAIEAAGVAVGANLAGLNAGWEAARSATATPLEAANGLVFAPAPEPFAAAVAALPSEIQALAGHALARLVDYQDADYARLYLTRLETVLAADRAAGGAARGFSLSAAVARRLAAWMAFEDVIRVAELKTRPGRLARIQADMGAGAGEPVHVTDYLSPGRDEMASLLPAALARLLPAARAGTRPRRLALRLPTSQPAGYAALKLLAALKRWRRHTSRFGREQQAIDAWLAAVNAAAASGDHDLARGVAELAVWARGYGDVRARGGARLEALLGNFDARLASDRAGLAADIAASRAAARDNPDDDCRPT